MKAIIKREILSYFTLATGYVLLAGFYIMSGLFFYLTSLMQRSTNLTYLFNNLFLVVVLFIPVLTMRLFSEEKKQRTDQALLTAPVSLFSIVFGKYVAAMLMFLCCISITLVYGLVVSFFGFTDWPVIFGNFIGLFLLGAAFCAIGLFISSLTENQIIAGFAMLGIGILIMLFDNISEVISVDFLSKLMTQLSFLGHYKNFTLGVLDLFDVVFFLSISGLFVFLTTRVLEKKRWS